jgi:hypothetical protein
MLIIQQDSGVRIKPYDGTIWSSYALSCAHNNSVVHITFFYLTTWYGVFNADFYDVSDTCITTMRTA